MWFALQTCMRTGLCLECQAGVILLLSKQCQVGDRLAFLLISAGVEGLLFIYSLVEM